MVQPTKFPQAQFKQNNDVLTSKEYCAVFVLGLRLDFSFGGLIYASKFINIFIVICIKFYMNFDGMILTFYTSMDLCGTLCTPGQVLEDYYLVINT